MLNSPGLIAEHLKTYHLPISADRNNKLRCEWRDETSHCQSLLKDVNGLVRHIATVHYKLSRVVCHTCGQIFSRKDSRTRHIDEGRCKGKLQDT